MKNGRVSDGGRKGSGEKLLDCAGTETALRGVKSNLSCSVGNSGTVGW